MKRIILAAILLTTVNSFAQSSFTWPDGKQMAMSLSFDDARESQVTMGTPLFDQYGVKATFYVVPASVKKQLVGWKTAVKSGHEIGNHSLTHPCTGNFSWSRKNALEEYSLDRMKSELVQCNQQIKEILNVDSKVFAYPCGQKFVGSGVETKSYVPLVAEQFQSGRGWMDEAPNDPLYCNFSQLTCIEIDGKTFEQLLPLINEAKKNGLWLIFGGHEINVEGNQTTRIKTLKKLITYVQDPANGIWIQPVGTVSNFIKDKRGITN